MNPAAVDQAIIQLAMFMQHRDARTEDGSTGVTWEILGLVGQEAYLKDARSYIGAMLAMGWTARGDAELEKILSGTYSLDLSGADPFSPIIITEATLS